MHWAEGQAAIHKETHTHTQTKSRILFIETVGRLCYLLNYRGYIKQSHKIQMIKRKHTKFLLCMHAQSNTQLYNKQYYLHALLMYSVLLETIKQRVFNTY